MAIQKGKDAPLLIADGDKWNHKGSRSKENSNGFLFIQVPLMLYEYINNTLTGNHGNHLKLMLLFIGTQENNFRITKKMVLDRTGMAQDKYYKARQDLEDMGWITCENDTICVNYDFLWEQALLPPEKRIDVKAMRRKVAPCTL